MTVGSDCYPTKGSWTCPYSGRTHTVPANVDIDHMVPLKNAWIVSPPILVQPLEIVDLVADVSAQSGASSWTTTRRTQFANDVSGPQLWATDGSTNSAKGDKSPDAWKPPLTGIWCTYAKSWIQVKSTYSLRISSAEKSALSTMLDRC